MSIKVIRLRPRRKENFSKYKAMRDLFPHYHLVPKKFDANLRFRRECVAAGDASRSSREALRGMCKADPLFSLNVFGWTHSTKDYVLNSHRPFISYAFQDEIALQVLLNLGERDVVLPKSRDMGVSWMVLSVFEHLWRWHEGLTFLCLSRKKELVDQRSDPNTLFYKIDYLHQHTPEWLLPPGVNGEFDGDYRKVLNIRNPETGSVINGEATVPDAGRGDRWTAVFMDEHAAMDNAKEISAATRDTTRTRISVSTPKGTVGRGEEFYHWAHSEPTRKVFTVHWSLHPEKSVHLYRAHPDTREIEKLDVYHEYPEDIEYVYDGKLRSPWYDNERKRCTNDHEADQELDINYLRTGAAFFRPEFIESLIVNAVPPVRRGEIVWQNNNMNDVAFERTAVGNLLLWVARPNKEHNYFVGADVAAGTGGDYASNSTLCVFDGAEGRKVAEYAYNNIEPRDFARYAVALCYYFRSHEGPARLIWEANAGPGQTFLKTIKEIGYRRIYYRRPQDRLSVKRNRQVPGWNSTKQTKFQLLKEYGEALRDKAFFNPSEPALRECLEYVYTPDGSVEHDKSLNADSGSEAGQMHGDRVIADSLAWLMAKEYPQIREPSESSPPPGSFGWRLQQRLKQQKQAADPWQAWSKGSASEWDTASRVNTFFD